MELNVSEPSKALLLLVVEHAPIEKSYRWSFAGQWCAPLSALRPGFRVLRLQHASGAELDGAYLWLRTALTEPSAKAMKLRGSH